MRNPSPARDIVLLTVLLCGAALGCWSGKRSDDDNKWENISKSTPDKKSSATPANDNKEMTKTNSGGFKANLPAGFSQPTDDVGTRMLKEYGALFVARGGAKPPSTVVFKDEGEVSAYQASLSSATESFGGTSVTLQSAAVTALKEAAAEASSSGLSITPRGADASKRTYADTVTLWKSRVDPGLASWTGKGRITAADAARIRALSPFEQVPEIFKLEAQGIYFSKDMSKSIIYSVAPPGTSQHLSMLALDVEEFENPRVRSILANHGWFQTVVSDLPHFTFLGMKESELTGVGLKRVDSGGRTFWVPDI